jgi:hypothetical protein
MLAINITNTISFTKIKEMCFFYSLGGVFVICFYSFPIWSLNSVFLKCKAASPMHKGNNKKQYQPIYVAQF